MSSSPLPKKKIEVAIDRLEKRERDILRKLYHSGIPLRHGSPSYASKHKNGLNDEERKLMIRCRKQGMSFRELEGSFRLFPNSGNDAYRCVHGHGTKKARTAAKASRPAQISPRQFRALAVRFAASNPDAAKSVFKEVVLKKNRKEVAAV